jgi:hypothetical protein
VTGAVTGLLLLLQQGPGVEPLGVEPPIGGPFWTVVVPALLLLGACLATYLLYRRFSGE